MGTKELARDTALFADALAEYDHLPEVAFVGVSRTGAVLANLAPADVRDGLRAVATWADAFGVPVRVTFRRDVELCDVDTYVEVGGRELRLRHTASPEDVRGLDFGIDVTQGRWAEVSAARVLKAVAS